MSCNARTSPTHMVFVLAPHPHAFPSAGSKCFKWPARADIVAWSAWAQVMCGAKCCGQSISQLAIE
eukprot:6477956-Amphidinium_carterae.1